MELEAGRKPNPRARCPATFAELNRNLLGHPNASRGHSLLLNMFTCRLVHNITDTPPAHRENASTPPIDTVTCSQLNMFTSSLVPVDHRGIVGAKQVVERIRQQALNILAGAGLYQP
jgi:hypothetical protein